VAQRRRHGGTAGDSAPRARRATRDGGRSRKGQRVGWGETRAELAATDPRVVVLDGDLATSTRADIVADRQPDSFIEVGIAEQTLVGMAVGMSTLGYRPWLSTFGVFLTARALDQVRMLVSQTKSPVRLAASYSGLLNGSSGKTHQDIEDLAIMRAMPAITVIAPADCNGAGAANRWAPAPDGPGLPPCAPRPCPRLPRLAPPPTPPPRSPHPARRPHPSPPQRLPDPHHDVRLLLEHPVR